MPQYIDWKHLYEIYQKYQNMNNNDGKAKINNIRKGLEKISYIYQEKLNKMKSSISQSQFSKQFYNNFYQATILNQQTVKFNSKLIITKVFLLSIGSDILQFFQSQCQRIKKQLNNYNFNIKDKIFNLRRVEQTLKSVFTTGINKESISPEYVSTIDKIKDDLLSMLCLQSQTPNEQRQRLKGKTIINLFEKLKQFLQNKIGQSYYGSQFKLDDKFKKYYISLKNDNDSNKQRQLEQLTKSFFNQQIDNYVMLSKTSRSKRQQKQKFINEQIQFLPFPLNSHIRKLFQQKKKEVTNNMQSKIQNLSKDLSKQPKQFDKFFIQMEKIKNNNQNQLYQLFTNKLIQSLDIKMNQISTISQFAIFIKDYFINVIQRNRKMIDQDSQSKIILDQKYQKSCRKLIDFTAHAWNRMIQFIYKKIYKQSEFKQKWKQCFQLYELTFQLKNCTLSKTKTIVSQISQIYNSKISQFKKAYEDNVNNVFSEMNFNIQVLLDDKSYNKFYKEFTQYKSICENYQQLKSYVKNNINVLDSQIINIQILSQIKNNTQNFNKINFIQERVTKIIQQVQQFEFYNDQIKNKPEKQLNQHLKMIDQYLKILSTRNQFINQLSMNNIKIKYDINELNNQTQKKFSCFYQQCCQYMEGIFEKLDKQDEYKLNTLLTMIKIAKQSGIKFINNQNNQNKFTQIIKQVNNNFEKKENKYKQLMDGAKKLKNQVDKQVNKIQDQRNNQILQKDKQIKNTYKKKYEQMQENMNELIKNQKEEKKKLQLEKKKQSQKLSYESQEGQQIRKKIEQINKKYDIKVESKQKQLKQSFDNLAQTIVLYKKASLNITYQHARHQQKLQKIMTQIESCGKKFVTYLIKSLDQTKNDQKSIGKIILNENKVFNKYVHDQREQKVKNQGIQYVLKNLKEIRNFKNQQIQQQKIQDLRKLYEQFLKQYHENIKKYQKSPNDGTIKLLTRDTKDLGTKLKTIFYFCEDQNNRQNGEKVRLLAKIFALWSIIKSEKDQQSSKPQFPIHPHPTQIICLILLLGMQQEDQTLKNRFSQFGTGQGKSVILAGLSCYLALVGYKVRCACYSPYLSSRDAQNFKNLFNLFDINKQIKYGTFNQLCQDILNSDNKNFQKQVQTMILQKPEGYLTRFLNFTKISPFKLSRGKNQIKQNPTVLIIDEVDVFFDDNFFGKAYCPLITLRHEKITKLLQKVWLEYYKNTPDMLKILQDSSQFQQVVKQFPSLQKILKNQLNGMIDGAIGHNHDYICSNNKIMYKDNDTLSSSLNFGYKTLFAHMFEYKRGNISYQSYADSLGIDLLVAQFSYAKLTQYFNCILGVTGTLEVMPQYKKQQLKDRVKVQNQYLIPSSFGLDKPRIQKYHVVSQQKYYLKIIQLIDSINDNRPIIIFFKNVKQLIEFSLSPEYHKYQYRSINLTQEHDKATRNARIIRATMTKSITLSTNSFGRGTDFIIVDKNIKQKGGLHIIQCFLSLQQSQQIQIKGRTARQSDKGSYDCVINEKQLELLNINVDSFNPPNDTAQNIHKILANQRENNTNRLASSKLKQLQITDKRHIQVTKIYSQQNLSQKQLIAYIQKLNFFPEKKKQTIRTIVGLDGTGSMGDVMKKACLTISQSFQRCYEILNMNKAKLNFEIKIMIFRNYNSSHEEIIQSTSFQSTPFHLKQFLDKQGPSGGWGNQAVQVFLQAANKDNRVNEQNQKQLHQIILIGDAPPNLDYEVTKKRQYKGQNYWNKNNFMKTTTNIQLEKIVKNNIPVHTFYLNNAKKSFTQISKATNGECSQFDVQSPRAVNLFCDFIVLNILKMIGKHSEIDCSEQLASDYKKTYKNK